MNEELSSGFEKPTSKTEKEFFQEFLRSCGGQLQEAYSSFPDKKLAGCDFYMPKRFTLGGVALGLKEYLKGNKSEKGVRGWTVYWHDCDENVKNRIVLTTDGQFLTVCTDSKNENIINYTLENHLTLVLSENPANNDPLLEMIREKVNNLVGNMNALTGIKLQ